MFPAKQIGEDRSRKDIKGQVFYWLALLNVASVMSITTTTLQSILYPTRYKDAGWKGKLSKFLQACRQNASSAAVSLRKIGECKIGNNDAYHEAKEEIVPSELFSKRKREKEREKKRRDVITSWRSTRQRRPVHLAFDEDLSFHVSLC